MRRFAFFAALYWFGIIAFSQSPPTVPRTQQALPAPPPSRQLWLGFDTGQLAPISPLGESNKNSCSIPIADQSQPNAQDDINQLLHIPCFNPKTLREIARMDVPARQNRLLEPIPTQWPDAKMEQIPTTWPKAKMAPMTPTPTPAK